jgi:hypothetical protein
MKGRFNDLALEIQLKIKFQNNKTILKTYYTYDANYQGKKAIVCNAIAIKDGIVLKRKQPNETAQKKQTFEDEKVSLFFQTTANTNYSIYGKKKTICKIAIRFD